MHPWTRAYPLTELLVKGRWQPTDPACQPSPCQAHQAPSHLIHTAHLVLLGARLLLFKLDPLWKQGKEDPWEGKGHKTGAKWRVPLGFSRTCLDRVGNNSDSGYVPGAYTLHALSHSVLTAAPSKAGGEEGKSPDSSEITRVQVPILPLTTLGKSQTSVAQCSHLQNGNGSNSYCWSQG